MRRARWWVAGVLAFGLTCSLLSWLTDPSNFSTFWYSLGGFGLVAVMAVAIPVRDPRPRWPWVLLALGLLGTASGDLLWDLTEIFANAPGYSSQLANISYLAAYPLFAAGALGLLGRRATARDVLVLLEAAILAAAAWLILWVVYVHPALVHSDLGYWDWLPTVLYPPMDLVVIVVVWRVGHGAGGQVRRSAPWVLLMLGFVVMFLADWSYAMLGMPESGTAMWLMNVAWLMSYALIAASAVHPAMRYLRASPDTVGVVAGRVRGVGVAGACVTPFALALVARRDVAPIPEVVAIAGTLIVLLAALRYQLAADRNAEAAVQLSYRATHDPLTGLANRAALIDRLTLALRRAARTGSGCAIVFLDLDDFKFINDSLGHTDGDAALGVVADRLRSVMRADECIARIGGDEFVVVLEGLSGAEDAILAAHRIAALLAEPYQIDHATFTLPASVGVLPDAERYVDQVEAALRDADFAMYEAKARARGAVCVYDPAMHARAIEAVDRRRQLGVALDAGELAVVYQPIYRAGSRRQIGAEALLRWRHDGVDIAPEDFVPLAESTGDIVRIGEWVLREAVEELRRLGPDSELIVTVNLSPRQLREPHFAAIAVALVEAAGVDPGRVVLELTESALLEPDPTVDANLRALGDARLALAIDDFGTGYSSLAYLKRLEVAWLKIDRIFVSDLGPSTGDEALVRTIIRMAHDLGIRVIAEGVENESQLAILEHEGCDALQGFALARPGPHLVLAPAPVPASTAPLFGSRSRRGGTRSAVSAAQEPARERAGVLTRLEERLPVHDRVVDPAGALGRTAPRRRGSPRRSRGAATTCRRGRSR